MAGELLRADAGVLESGGQEMIACGTASQDTMTRMKNQVENLRGTFEGSAADAFYMKMESMFQQMQTLIDEINEMGNDLKTTATRVRQVQAEAEALLRD